jgi:hypothetical protein
VRGWRALVGVVAVGVYVVGAWLTARSGPVGRGPLLDGFAPGGPYHWVSPPPQLRTGNHAPAAARFTVALDRKLGSAAAVFTTTDNQAAVALQLGSIPPSDGQTQATLSITPIAPGSRRPLPGEVFDGNVYRIEVRYADGTPLQAFAVSTQVVLAYPADVSLKHAMLASAGGRSWRSIGGADSLGQQMVQAQTTAVGDFAVASPAAAAGPASSRPSLLPWVAVGVVVLLLVVVVIAAVGRHRRGRPSHPPPEAASAAPPPRLGGRLRARPTATGVGSRSRGLNTPSPSAETSRVIASEACPGQAVNVLTNRAALRQGRWP